MLIKIFCIAIFVSFIATWLAIKFFPKIGLLDFPERYGLKRKKIPYPGGLVFCILALFVPVFDILFLPLSLAIIFIGSISFYDDLHPLPAKFRSLLYSIIITVFFFLGIKIDFIGNPFGGPNIQLSPILSFIITIIWIFSIQQSLNWFDGIKGLAVGIGGIGFFFLGILGLTHPELFFDPIEKTSLWANFFLSGLCFGGWWYFFRGKIILGDTGAQTIGFLLATMSIFTGAKIGTTILILALPILDTVAVIFRRIFIEKNSPLKSDKKHIHHNLAKIFNEKKAVLLLLGVSIILGIIGISMKGFSKLLAIILVSIVIFLCILWSFSKTQKKIIRIYPRSGLKKI